MEACQGRNNTVNYIHVYSFIEMCVQINWSYHKSHLHLMQQKHSLSVLILQMIQKIQAGPSIVEKQHVLFEFKTLLYLIKVYKSMSCYKVTLHCHNLPVYFLCKGRLCAPEGALSLYQENMQLLVKSFYQTAFDSEKQLLLNLFNYKKISYNDYC